MPEESPPAAVAVRGHRRLFALATVLLTLLLALLAAEGVVRLLGLGGAVRSHFRPGIYRPDSELIWALKPSYRGLRLEEHMRVPTSTNALGFRGPEWDEARRQAPLRVLVLGDSCTFGLGVADDETYPAQLETILRERGLPVAVFNSGVPGYGTEQEEQVFERLADVVKPDLVLLTWLPNDAMLRGPRSRMQVRDGYLVQNMDRYLKWRDRIDNKGAARSALYRYVRIRARLVRDQLGGRRRTWQREVDAETLRPVTEALARIQTRARSMGAEMFLALLPRREQVEGALGTPALSQVEEFARASGMQVIDLLEAWRAEGIDTRAYYLHDNAHLTGHGYGRMALRLADAFQTRFARVER